MKKTMFFFLLFTYPILSFGQIEIIRTKELYKEISSYSVMKGQPKELILQELNPENDTDTLRYPRYVLRFKNYKYESANIWESINIDTKETLLSLIDLIYKGISDEEDFDITFKLGEDMIRTKKYKTGERQSGVVGGKILSNVKPQISLIVSDKGWTKPYGGNAWPELFDVVKNK
jgi:hypothetical protein